MIRARSRIASAICAGALAAGCASPHVRTPQPQHAQPQPQPQPQSETDVVLLPDPGTGAVGRAIVSNAAGSVELTTARAATHVITGQAPRPAAVLGESDTSAWIKDVMATLPKAPEHFTLYFEFQSDELTAESKALVAQVVAAVKAFPAPEVVFTGHTDTTGSRKANVQLGLKRANVVRKLLVTAGLDRHLIQVFSHGESDLLVPTRNNVYEARNRRVEISVR